MQNNQNSIKFHVGSFSVTDSKGALVISSKVEVNREFTDGIFWIGVYPFDKNMMPVSVAFNGVEIRSFASQIKDLYYGALQNVVKHSGGKSATKTLSVSIIDDYSSIDFKEKNSSIHFRILKTSLVGLAAQIEHLADTTMEASYKTQQHLMRKKRKDG